MATITKTSLMAVCVAAVLGSSQGKAAESGFSGHDRLTLPVQVYCYSFEAAPELDCTLTRAEMEQMFAGANRIWSQAGIQWTMVSFTDKTVDAGLFPALSGTEERSEIRERLLAMSPRVEAGRGLWALVVVHASPVPAGGFYFAKTHTVYFSETTHRGKTTPVVLAHELGHSLGLPHSEEESNLMFPGKPSVRKLLTAAEISRVRAQARRGPASLDEMGPRAKVPPAKRPARGRAMGDRTQMRHDIAERLRSFDSDLDGVIHLNDVPSKGRQAFRRIDVNHDDMIDSSELERFEQGRRLN